jgi:glucokinase
MTLTIGVDVGGTKIAAGVVDEAGTLLATTRRETPATDPELIEAQIADAVHELRATHEVAAVGVAAAGFCSRPTWPGATSRWAPTWASGWACR